MSAYVAPAAWVFSEAHIPAAPTSPVQFTRCGVEMDPADIWLPVELRDRERVCKGCRGEPEDEQGSLL